MNVRIIAKQSAEDLLKWGSLSLKGLNVRTEPNQVTLDSVSLTDPYFRVDVAPDSSVNLTKLTVDNQAEPPTAEKPQQQQESTPVELKSITLAGAVIDFSDRHIQPNYRMKFINLAGRVSRMSSEESGGGEVNLLGNLDGYAPLEITGLLNPFAKNLLVDLKIDFRNMDLNPLTPYSARYLGYKIEKGKLDLALTYKILNRKLDSQNKIVFDQFTLGEEVESPDAVKLPVRFALALLTDRNGMIDLDVPITGTLDDPDFSYGKILWKVLVNIITKAATAPFALLGSLFGGGDELSFVPFAPAVDNLDQGATGRLDKLAKALTERPALRLEIAGHADPDLDAPGLRDLALERKLKTQKLKEAIKLGQQAAGLEAITVTAEERPKFIEMVFKDEKIPRPAKEARPLTAEEMEKLIITRITIGSDDLKLLTRKRVATVRDYLIDQGKLDPKRVFLAETPTENSAKKENVPAGRVEFTLK
ncbi:MAG: hypothetical protein A2511_11205 [Deltaproteobacteria bacterium RIFOXYD12_FULL_50_9]|nr:MAG: hypothetical protein A2511_11205 [Deltaproteobacteria bacterium RIFOXYD12_FULL_50_9]